MASPGRNPSAAMTPKASHPQSSAGGGSMSEPRIAPCPHCERPMDAHVRPDFHGHHVVVRNGEVRHLGCIDARTREARDITALFARTAAPPHPAGEPADLG